MDVGELTSAVRAAWALIPQGWLTWLAYRRLTEARCVVKPAGLCSGNRLHLAEVGAGLQGVDESDVWRLVQLACVAQSAAVASVNLVHC